MSAITPEQLTELKSMAAKIKRQAAKLDRDITSARQAVAEAELPFQDEIRAARTRLFELQEQAADASEAARERVRELESRRKDAGVSWMSIAEGLAKLDEHSLAALRLEEHRYIDRVRQTWHAARDRYGYKGVWLPGEIKVDLNGSTKSGSYHCRICAAKLGDLGSATAETPEQALAGALEASVAEFWRRYELGH
jgi:hypothetical protein